MEVDIPSFFSASLGAGFALLFGQFIFNRLINQVDSIANKVAKLEIIQAKILDRVEKFDRVESDVNDASTRLVRLETIVDRGKQN